MKNTSELNYYTKVYGIYKSTHPCNFKKMALTCFFLNEFDAGEIVEDMQQKDNNAFYHIFRSTYGEIFQGGISYVGPSPKLFENLNEYYGFLNIDDEKQL